MKSVSNDSESKLWMTRPWMSTSGQRFCGIIAVMKATMAIFPRAFLVVSASLAPLLAQTPGSQQQPEFMRQGQQLMREGKLDDALALYRRTLEASPNSLPALLTSPLEVEHTPRRDVGRKGIRRGLQRPAIQRQRVVQLSFAHQLLTLPHELGLLLAARRLRQQRCERSRNDEKSSGKYGHGRFHDRDYPTKPLA